MMKRVLGLLVTFGVVSAIGCASGPDTNVDEATANFTQGPPSGGGEALPEQDEINGFYVGGYEYWPYKEAEPIYPNKVQWGFEAGSEPARLCMAESARALAKILQDPPAKLVEFKTKHGVSSFYNWNNDYTGAPRDGMGRFRDLWLYEGNLMKWISETNRDGSCRIPTREDLERLATRCLDTFPRC